MLELKNICFSKDGKDILKNINLKIENERLFAITGPNGGGKSTLAKLIMGIYTPTSGKILLNGEDITNLSITERANKGIGFAFQQPVNFKGLKVKDLIKISSSEDIKSKGICDILSSVGLCAKEYMDREIDSSLSGGELKRIEIASVVSRKCEITIFDEPEAGIDLWSFNNLINLFEKMHKEVKGTIIIISHQEKILNLADEVIVVADGTILKKGQKEKVLPELLCINNCKCIKGGENDE